MDKKNFREKIERNRKNFEKMEKKAYTPKTDKPKPVTYEADFHSITDAFDNIGAIIDFNDFINAVNVSPAADLNYFDSILHNVAEFMLKRTPQLQHKRNIHTKFSISVNGFSVKFENNTGLDVTANYSIVDGVAEILSVHCAITIYGKVHPDTLAVFNKSDIWKKKMFNKKPSNFQKKPSHKKDGDYNKKPYVRTNNNRSYNK